MAVENIFIYGIVFTIGCLVIGFLLAVFIDQKVTAWVEVIHIREDKPIVTLRTWVENEMHDIVIDGKAVVFFLKED